MVDRRTVLKGGIAFGSLGLVSTALGQESALVVHDFDGGAYPGSNDLGNWAGAGSFANGDGSGEVADGALRLEYDNAGWFASNVRQSVADHGQLTMRVRGDAGGEESDFLVDVGGARDLLGNLTDDTIGTEWSTVSVDLSAVGSDPENPKAVRFNFWQGASGAVEIDRIAFTSDGEAPPSTATATPTPTSTPTDTPDDDTPTPTDTPDDDTPTDTPDDDTPTDAPDDGGSTWDVPFPERPPAPDSLPAASEITEDTTVAELYDGFDDPYYVPRSFTDYLPGETGSKLQEWTDTEKAEEFDYDVSAVEDNVGDGSLTLGQLGTQALPYVKQLAENDFPAHATVKLLPRLALLPDEEEDPGVHDEPSVVWDETAGPTAATNDPDQLIQDRWPTDARTYQPMEVRVRDRAHDQPQYDDSREWASSGSISDSFYNDETNPLLDAAAEKVHPATGESLGGDGFTANAPMEAEIRIHETGGSYINQYLKLTNTSEVPYFQDAAVIWWLGPSGNASNLSDGHWNNPHRPSASLGHPQRDVIEVNHPDYDELSVYAVRLANHDEPYHMRTIYPGQSVAMEIGTPRDGSAWSTSAERQDLVDTMLDSLHVELETNLDRNDPIVDAVDLTYRVPN
ncbi:hypothetical protein I7X12_06420 [Halosimplex litoreum]|uniref:Uncharacterized protein n=1 Tax=Halosimplex litoreum TaxID=1198301 RepID=A0A7T3G0R5_9EURY|nr:hypothetical protein [Halosimplex litoreum]QPV64250.1 hypothetical protein I7X12_06420 [Halosimplex litoreum]